ncbi:MAG TPA: sigma-70 family RNA polymerase sigma factor [Stellaceae bacterium]|nr:sigma-70 family RNA polymerase sigma factor [Stellaceae bacterium]
MAPVSESFEQVAVPHLDAAYNLARWLMRGADEAEDVVQEAMVRALTYFPSFRGDNARGWILQIVRNTAYASMKLNRGAALVPIDDEESGLQLVDPGDDPEATLLRSEDRQTIEHLLARLPVELREVLVLREIEELSYKEVAAIAGVPIGTVMSRLWRARRLLADGANVEARRTG